MSQIKNGMKPLSQKKTAQPPRLNADDLFSNKLGLDPEIAKKIEAKGMECRFINAKILQDMGGWNEKGWRPIKLSDVCDNVDVHSFQFGVDPNGLIRRGDLVLAVRDKAICEKHRQYIKQENERVKIRSTSKFHAEELRKSVASAGLDATILEGYEDDEK